MAALDSRKQKGRGTTRREGGDKSRPLLQWIASGTGLVLAVTGTGYIVWNGITASDGPPSVTVELEGTVELGDGYVAEIVAENHAAATAAHVTVAGELKRDGQTIETSRTEFDYIPGHAMRNGGLYFQQDPREFELELRAYGYSRP
jgi:uncharacterized protein (TIGR02588 family)